MLNSPWSRKLLRAALVLSITVEIVVLGVQWQDIRSKIAVAQNARDRQKGEADKVAAEARNAEEVAANAPARQVAEAQIAEAKAEQELQAARQAERRTAADADRIEAEARTAKEEAANAVQRSRAEAAKAKAELSAIEARIKLVWRYPYNCYGFDSFAACVEGLRLATANGQWKTPRPPRSSAAPMRAPQLTPACARALALWKVHTGPHTAFAVGDDNCGWSDERLSNLAEARAQAERNCSKYTANCQIYAEK